MEKMIDKIIREYKKNGSINIYIVGNEGTGKSLLSQQIIEKICLKLDILPSIGMIDVVNDISKIEGINLIETNYDSEEYKYKVETPIEVDLSGNFIRGLFRFDINKFRGFGRFRNGSIFSKEYHQKKKALLGRKYDRVSKR